MANVYATTSIVAKTALAVLENMLPFSSSVNRDYEDEYGSNMARAYAPGNTINLKRPPRYTWRQGRVASPQPTVETTIPVTLQQGGIEMFFTGNERTTSLVKLEAKIQAAMATVANEIERQGLQMARLQTANIIGTPGTLPTTQALALAAITQLNQRLDEMAAPRDDNRTLTMNPALNAAAVQGFAGLFNAQGTLSKQFQRGVMVDSLGLAYNVAQNVDLHTNGTQPVGTGTVNGSGQGTTTYSQTGFTLNVNSGTITGTITRGSKITLGGVFAVNPQSRVSTGTLAQFTVLADVDAAATTISISPALVTSGPFQNVTGSPANAAAITIFGTASGSYNASAAFHKNAFTLAMVPMWMPPAGKGLIDVAMESYRGMNMKVTEFVDGVQDNYIMRFDVLYAWAAPYPELACLYAT